MSKSKTKGTSFESDCAAYMRRRLGDDRIERRALNGVNARGDIAGLRIRCKRLVVECKNHRRMELAEWLEEAEVERLNDDAEFKCVLHKRRGCGEKNFGKNYVTMELDDLLAIIAGARGLLDD